MTEYIESLPLYQLIFLYKEVFVDCDRNQDGGIDSEELRHFLERQAGGVSEERLQQMIREVDIDKNGTINFAEFLSMMKIKIRTIVDLRKKISEMFQTFDVDGDGAITGEELKLVLERLGGNLTEEQTEVIIKRYDDNGDGVVSLDEFLTIVEEIMIM